MTIQATGAEATETEATEQPRWLTLHTPILRAAAFRSAIYVRTVEMGLNPNLPEFQKLRRNALKIVTGHHREEDPFRFLAAIDPEHSVYRLNDGTIVLAERVFGPWVLYPETVARFHIRDLDNRLTRIVADERGACLYVDGDARPTFIYNGGIIYIGRFNDPGNRYENACLLIKALTGRELHWQSYVGLVHRIIATRINDTWVVLTENSGTRTY
jgi:hypothetical protein